MYSASTYIRNVPHMWAENSLVKPNYEPTFEQNSKNIISSAYVSGKV